VVSLTTAIFLIPRNIGGRLTVASHYVAPGQIPWCYLGCNKLFIQTIPPTSQETVTFGTDGQIFSDDPAVVAPLIVAAFDATFLAGGTTCVFDPVGNKYDCTVTTPIDLIWISPTSDAKFAFGKKNSGNELNVSSFSLAADDVDSRPKYLAVYFVESSTVNGGTKIDPGDFLISTFDEEVRGSILSLEGVHSQVGISFRRTNVPLFPVPFPMKWELLFTG